MARPFEYNARNGGRLFDTRLNRSYTEVALLCSFKSSTESVNSPFYDFDSLKYTVQDVCNKLGAAFEVVGRNFVSHLWMEEVMELLIGADHLVIDISDPQPNVLYELGIACALRDQSSVIIAIDERAKISASDIYQMQLLRYSDKDDLREKLLRILSVQIVPTEEEERILYEQIHRRISIGAILLLNQMLQSHLSRIDRESETNPWHTHFPVDRDLKEPSTGNWTLFAHELIREGLARFEYGENAKENGLSWAIHPTKLGERYISSKYFLKIFVDDGEIAALQAKLK